MAKWTTAQLREKELKRLVSFKTDDPTEADFAEARRNMNSYYRLCGLAETNLYLANDERTCNRESTKRSEEQKPKAQIAPKVRRSEERESKWYNRLDKTFNDTYGLRLVYCGYFPSIGTLDERGGFSGKISTYFYN